MDLINVNKFLLPIGQNYSRTRKHIIHHWNPCPGEWNSADDGTRGIPFRDFYYSTRWFQGLYFLKKPASDRPLNPAHPQAWARVSASFSSAGPTTQVNSYPGIEFAQEATEVATEEETTAAEVVTEEEETTAAEVATEEETTAAEVATEEEETTAAEVTTEEEEETTSTEVAKSDEGKPGATKATVVATVSPLPKPTAHITVPAH